MRWALFLFNKGRLMLPLTNHVLTLMSPTAVSLMDIELNLNTVDHNPILRRGPPCASRDTSLTASDTRQQTCWWDFFCSRKGSNMLRIEQLHDNIGQVVHLSGWVHSIRTQKRMQFLILRDVTGKVQGIIDRQTQPDLGERLAQLTRESTVKITGTVALNPQVRMGGIEIQISDFEVFSLADPILPVDLSSSAQSGVETRMDWRFLDLRRHQNCSADQ